LLETRPIYHHWVKDNVKGHIFACFLALYLVVVLRKKIATLGRAVEWADLMRDLSQLRAIGLQLDDQHYLLRTDLRGTAHVASRRWGFAPRPSRKSSRGRSRQPRCSGKVRRLSCNYPSDRHSLINTVEDGLDPAGRVVER
jgi:hypothetical protein